MTVDLETIIKAREEADCLVDATRVNTALDRMAVDITHALGSTNPLVYTVMHGGLIFAGRILPRLPFPLELAYLHATRYGHAECGTALNWQVHPTGNPRGRTILVLDDILDEGRTLHAVIEYLKQAGATSVYSAVLVHKQHERKAYPGMRADFTGLEVEDRFLFGCGMDYKGYWRNAPGIYAVKGL